MPRSRNWFSEFGVEKARLKLTRNAWSGAGLKTTAARGEKIGSGSAECSSMRPEQADFGLAQRAQMERMEQMEVLE